MILSWRRRRHGLRPDENGLADVNLETELTIPTHFRCPITLDLMKDPVTLPTGITYDRESIERWIEAGNQTCPVTNQVLATPDQIPNHTLRRMIQDWCVRNSAHGIERIPTPRIPVTARQVSEACSCLISATRRADQGKYLAIVGKIKAWATESERNRRCAAENGAGAALAAALESFSSNSIEDYEGLLSETLSALMFTFPLRAKDSVRLGSPMVLRCISWFLKGEDLSARQNAVLAAKEILASEPTYAQALAEIEGVDEALVRIIKEQTCPKATKASLMVIYYMTSPGTASEKVMSRFVDLDLVSMLLEIIVGGDKSLCEKSLGVLDNICSGSQGIEKAKENALTIPVLIKRILRVSSVATDFSVSILWRLLKTIDEDNVEGEVVEAVEVGGFQKLLVVLQVGCGGKTKEKVTELLKLLNQYMERAGCFDSSLGFKYLKRS
ncbi:Ubiquitin--protein ligase [Bertholletia excelsa]